MSREIDIVKVNVNAAGGTDTCFREAGAAMFQRLREYELIEAEGLLYRPRAYASPEPDGVWAGWLVFFPVKGGLAIAAPEALTTQSTLAVLADWADRLRPVYLEGALTAALRVANAPPVLTALAEAEAEALDAAASLDTSAELEHAAAEIVRAKAERLDQERRAAASTIAAADAAAAKASAALRERTAKAARSVAADTKGRSRRAGANARRPSRSRRQIGRKK